jgi:cell division protein FtsI (penicillin-binding protein 3)
VKIPGLRTRVLIVAAIVAAAFGGLALRLSYLQLFRHNELAGLASRQYSRIVVLQPQRGPIVDRHGAPLATSSPAESVFAHPRSAGDPVRVAARLAPILEMRESEVHAALVGGRPFVWLRRRVPPAVGAQVKALREPGVDLVPEPMRFYPNRELAAHVIGFVGMDGGLEGVERTWDKDLGGAPGKAITGRDALGRGIETSKTLTPPVAGQGVMLTLDTNIQYIAEREIEAAYQRTKSKSAMAVVMEPRTGDVLAIAIRPTFNPNALGGDARQREAWRNRAVTDPFEPGSTFKVIMAAAALEEGVVTPASRLYGENGAITIAKTTIHDWKKYGWLTFSEVLQNSSNVGSIKVGLSLGAERYHRYMTAFGFGTLTGVGLAGESRGLLREPSRWSALSLPTMSIGQEISVTALQLTAAFGAVANGGTLMQPRLVRSIFEPDGREIRRFDPVAVRQVVSPETARTLTRILTRVVTDGTGHNAAIAGYDVAGKTGTAQKLEPGTHRYSRAPGVLSFVGFAPADAPRFVMLVLLDEPKNEKWGSEAAAPIFAAIGRDILSYLDVPPRDVKAMQIEAAAGADRAPAAAAAGGVRAAAAADKTDGVARMPSLRGKSKRQVLALLAPLRVEVTMTGRGVVIDQDVAAGAPVDPGSTVRLTLASPTVRPLPPPAVPAVALTRAVTVTRTAAPAAERATERMPSAGLARASETGGEETPSTDDR